MDTRLLKSREILKSFLEKWTLDRVKRMTLSEYVDTGNPETFCQYIETQTQKLGSIKGHFSNKFGIYKRNNPSVNPSTLISDSVYSWLPYYGKSSVEAFENVKQDIIKIIVASQSGKFTEIDKIHLNHLVKWKIAFLYSNEQLVPIFKKDVLWDIAEHFGLEKACELPIAQLQSFIFSKKPSYNNIYQYATNLYREFGVEENNERSFYLIGSTYDENKAGEVFHFMEESNVVCTGFALDFDLTYLYRAKEKDIVEELKNKKEDPKSYNALKFFLQMKPGDIVAIKSTGNPKAEKPFLEIIAYAIVVEREGVVYWHDTENFGHCINVQFIQTGLQKQFELGGYSRTIHNITDKDLIVLLFGENANSSSNSVRQEIKKRRRTRKAVESKNTSEQNRKGSGAYVTNPKHNQIQQLFKEHLEAVFGKDSVSVQLEENNVDIKLFYANSITFYEVKPYDHAEDCIRDGLGQLLSYVFFDIDKSKREKKIKIVGPNPPDDEEKDFIAFLKQNLNIDFDYECFKIE
jgi:hypothetical protein